MNLLTENDLHQSVPAVFAIEANHSRSQRFAPVPTIEVLRGLAKEGFHPVGARQTRCRDSDRREYTKHLVRLRRPDDANSRVVGGAVFEILLKNANDGSSSYNLLAGLFRLVCLNGLVVGTASENIRARHTGDVVGKVIEGTYRVLAETERVLVAPSEWSKQQLGDDERLAFAEALMCCALAMPRATSRPRFSPGNYWSRDGQATGRAICGPPLGHLELYALLRF
jgi:hypothetical protein